jgi:hypothetical protein
MVVGSLVSYTLTSNDITYSVMSEAVFSTNQSVMSLPDPEVLKIKVMLRLTKKFNKHLILIRLT